MSVTFRKSLDAERKKPKKPVTVRYYEPSSGGEFGQVHWVCVFFFEFVAFENCLFFLNTVRTLAHLDRDSNSDNLPFWLFGIAKKGNLWSNFFA